MNPSAKSRRHGNVAPRDDKKPLRAKTGLRVKTHVKAGGLKMNHNQTLVRAAVFAG